MGANQNARKLLSTDLVNTKNRYTFGTERDVFVGADGSDVDR